MATDPTGTKTIGINMKLDRTTELEHKAASMQISKGAYCKIIFGQWLDSGKRLHLKEKQKV